MRGAIGWVAMVVLAVPDGAEAQSMRPEALEGAWLSDDGIELLRFDHEQVQFAELSPYGLVDGVSRALQVDGRGASQEHLVTESGEIICSLVGGQEETLSLRCPTTPWSTRFHHLSRLPDTARARAPSDPVTTLDVMAWMVGTRCPCLKERGVDWEKIVATARTKVDGTTTPRQLFVVMREALGAVGDVHFSLETGGVGSWCEDGKGEKALPSDADLERIRARIEKRYIMGTMTTACGGLLHYGRLANLVGYIGIDSFSHPGSVEGAAEAEDAARFGRQLDATIHELDFVESLVLDLRCNSGGYPSSVVEIASRFMKPGETLLSIVRDHDPDDPSLWRSGEKIRADDGDHPRFLRRLIVLTSRASLSGGEILPLALLGREPPATRIGEATQGAFCARGFHPLPNGWWFSFTDAALRSAKGESFEGRGLPPDVPVEVFAKGCVNSDRDAALEKALELLGER